MHHIVVTSGEARTNFRFILDQVISGKADVVIERNGKRVAVMIPVADYNLIREELDELRAAREAAAAYKEWKKNPSVGRTLRDF